MCAFLLTCDTFDGGVWCVVWCGVCCVVCYVVCCGAYLGHLRPKLVYEPVDIDAEHVGAQHPTCAS